MSTVYSLVCFGGRTGKTVSISASTDVVTLTGHGLMNGTKLWPSGTLPSELSTPVPVYARSTASNTFTLHTSSAGAIANTGQITFAGASTYAAVVLKSDLVADPANALAGYGLSDLSRWGASGSERIYDSLGSWITGRAAASPFDLEVCELGHAFDEIRASLLSISVPSGAVLITASVNGVLSGAHHRGVVGQGFKLKSTSVGCVAIGLNHAIEGFSLHTGGAGVYGCTLAGPLCRASQMIVKADGANNSTGFRINVSTGVVESCLAVGVGTGFYMATYCNAARIANCMATGCATGFGVIAATNINGFFYNNISVGNTTNWATVTSGIQGANKNAGLSGDAIWAVGSGATSITIATDDFIDHTAGDYRPADNASPQVDTATEYYGSVALDIANAVRPSYKGGAATYSDVGPYEFDHGYGPWPASHTLTLTNVVVGSRILIRDQADTTTHYSADAAASTVVIPITVYGSALDQWRIRIRKATASTFYQPFETLMTATAGESSLYISQIPDE